MPGEAPPVDEEAEAAEAAAEERRAKLAAEKSAAGGARPSVARFAATSKGGLENAARQPAPPSSGSLSDRRNILGVYDQRRSRCPRARCARLPWTLRRAS